MKLEKIEPAFTSAKRIKKTWALVDGKVIATRPYTNINSFIGLLLRQNKLPKGVTTTIDFEVQNNDGSYRRIATRRVTPL